MGSGSNKCRIGRLMTDGSRSSGVSGGESAPSRPLTRVFPKNDVYVYVNGWTNRERERQRRGREQTDLLKYDERKGTNRLRHGHGRTRMLVVDGSSAKGGGLGWFLLACTCLFCLLALIYFELLVWPLLDPCTQIMAREDTPELQPQSPCCVRSPWFIWARRE